MPDRTLDAEHVTRTMERLRRRVELRFPGSGLAQVALQLEEVARHTREQTAWIGRPILPLRVAIAALVALIAAGLGLTLSSLRLPREAPQLGEFVQLLESGINDVVLIGAAVFFLATLETRIKRRRALSALHRLRALAHIVDMHQLPKDPEWVLERGRETGVLPPRTLSAFELSRYLDYCSEMLSLIGKFAALYIQDFDDDVALAAVREIEQLTTGLSQKIWQKLNILYAMHRDEA